MIELNGIPIKRVINVQCDHSTDFKIYIDFYYDSKMTDNNNLLDFMKYDITQIEKEADENIGVFRIVLPQNTDISISTCE